MNILFASAEIAPYSKAGGLADVAGSLPHALNAFANTTQVISPLYGDIDQKKYRIEPKDIEGRITLGSMEYPYAVYSAMDPAHPKTSKWFIKSKAFFDRKGIYTDKAGEGFPDNNPRYFFFQLVILDLLEKELIDCTIIHCNDHHTGLLPALLKSSGINKKSIFTIHNFLYHGHFSKEELDLLPESVGGLLTLTQWDNYSALLEGISHADIATTVSKGYAKELLAGENIDSASHDRLLHLKNGLIGIVNGIDTEYWDPKSDDFIPHHYSCSDLSGKMENKRALLKESGLPQDLSAPLIGSISRLVENKGFPLIIELLAGFVKKGVKFVFLGTGDPLIATQLKKLSTMYPEHIAFENGFNERFAHLIEAGSDMFLMPSRFEPCGLNQLYSLRYGTIPIVNKTGGLGDTVAQWSPGKGTGFIFEPYELQGLKESIELAINTYQSKSEWTALIIRAMEEDYSWDWSAEQYYHLYESEK